MTKGPKKVITDTARKPIGLATDWHIVATDRQDLKSTVYSTDQRENLPVIREADDKKSLEDGP